MRGSSAALAGERPSTRHRDAAASARTRKRARRGTLREATGTRESYSRAGGSGDGTERAGTTTGTTPGTDVVPRAMPVPAPPPGVTDVLRRSAQLGLGAIGLAGRAAGSVFARVPDPGGDAPDPEPGIAALLPGAVLGMAIEAEKRAVARVIDTVAAHSTGVVRAVGTARDRAARAAAARGPALAAGTRWRAASSTATRRRPPRSSR